jgi:excisionase family DNA binding protein
METNLFLTVQEAAQQLRVSADTIRRFLRDKKLRGARVGGQWRIPTDALHGVIASAQPWHRRQEIPDPQVRDAADQFESARQLLFAHGSGVLCPLMNSAAVAIELYLKCLSAEKVYTDAGGGWSMISAAPPEHTHVLTKLLDKVGGDLQDELDHAWRAEPTSGALSFRDALRQCEGAFDTSRYPFEPNSDLLKYPLQLLMGCSHFLQQFVAKLQTTETIQYA